MKVNIVYLIIGLAISALIAFGFYSFYEGSNKNILVFGSMIFLSISLIPTIAIEINNRTRITALIRTVSGIMFFVGLLTNLIFSFTAFKQEWYIIILGLILMIYCMIIYSLIRSKQ
jgi:hypothetical protein